MKNKSKYNFKASIMPPNTPIYIPISPLGSAYFIFQKCCRSHRPLLKTLSFRAKIDFYATASVFISLVSPSFLLWFLIFLFVPEFWSSFLVFLLRSYFFRFACHFSSSFITSPLRSSFLLFTHHFSTSFIMSPLRSSFSLFAHHFSFLSCHFLLRSFIIFPLRSYFSSSFIISPLRLSFLLLMRIIFPLHSSLLLFAHHFSSSQSAASHVGHVFGTLSFCT